VAESGVAEVEVTTWSLELRRPSELRPSPAPDLELSLVLAKHPSPEL